MAATTPTLNLPTEMLLAISEACDPPTAMALSLTCKPLHSTLFPSSNCRLSSGHLIPFLHLLLKDLGPAHFVCLRAVSV
ncbi:hypothetical protein QBC38DRAFT_459073 [Podospora fimiseda]|uniref:F-box domain-containing protein n=1 Tax=Podospora fimiseda TaxID=252190 RepID=A0AAN7BI59_9PEZI|nr:hypothetical protein QBC38DRAFT_459073 [Podospora fimiseda]